MTTHTEPVFQAIQNAMRAEYERSGKVEWTIRELHKLADDRDIASSHKQVTNAIQYLKTTGKAVQTRIVPDSVGNAKYWALVRCLEMATAPQTKDQPEDQSQGEAMPDLHANTDADSTSVPNARKPRHNSAEHTFTELEKKLTEAQGGLRRDIAVMLSDQEKALKIAIAGVREAVAAPDGDALAKQLAAIVEHGNEQLQASASKVMEAMLESNANLAQDVIATLTSISGTLRDALGNDNAEMVGFQNGFAAGWAACLKQRDDEAAAKYREAGYKVTELTGGVIGVSIPIKQDEEPPFPQAKNASKNGGQSPLEDALKAFRKNS